MNREDIIRMALEAELIYDEECTSPWIEETNLTPFLERFAALVASAEREACAKVCEDMSGPIEIYNPNYTHYIDCAKAIRARGQA